jgi:uncharacterized metal-binding protein
MANAIAVALDRRGVAEMSCIAGVGGDVAPLVRTATSGRPIVAIDGCPLLCVQSCLARHDVTPDLQLVLRDLGVRRVKHDDFDPATALRITDEFAAEIQQRWPEASRSPGLPVEQ